MSAPPDPVEAIVAFLAADATVAALVNSRVYGVELPQSQIQSMPRKSIVVRRSGGGGLSAGDRSRVGLSLPRMDVFSYGETPYQASRVDLAAYGALKQMVANNQGACRLLDTQLAGGPIDLREPDTQWPLVFRSYLVAAAEVAVS